MKDKKKTTILSGTRPADQFPTDSFRLKERENQEQIVENHERKRNSVKTLIQKLATFHGKKKEQINRSSKLLFLSIFFFKFLQRSESSSNSVTIFWVLFSSSITN